MAIKSGFVVGVVGGAFVAFVMIGCVVPWVAMRKSGHAAGLTSLGNRKCPKESQGCLS